MARYRRRRFRRKSGRWSANIQEIGNSISAVPGTWASAETLMQNPAQTASAVTQTFTVKNIEITFNIEIQTLNNVEGITSLENITVYIMYVPQGMSITPEYNLQHPEYIMTYKYIGSPSNDGSAGTSNPGQQYQPIKVRTRLARKLQSGDNIVLFIKGVNQYTSNLSFRLAGLVRWWTKAN